ncbi:hypothetical protein RLIN73S_02602 [Rhodanobacter lindaniclasticus]
MRPGVLLLAPLMGSVGTQAVSHTSYWISADAESNRPGAS